MKLNLFSKFSVLVFSCMAGAFPLKAQQYDCSERAYRYVHVVSDVRTLDIRNDKYVLCVKSLRLCSFNLLEQLDARR